MRNSNPLNPNRANTARTGPGYPLEAMVEALSTILGWTVAMFVSSVVGFCAGYWLGHRQITGFQQTLSALVDVPLLWVGFWQMFIAYGVLAGGWYLPIRFDSLRLRIAALGVNLAVWLTVIHSIVIQTADAKMWHY